MNQNTWKILSSIIPPQLHPILRYKTINESCEDIYIYATMKQIHSNTENGYSEAMSTSKT